jgi:hypothetical protein
LEEEAETAMIRDLEVAIKLSEAESGLDKHDGTRVDVGRGLPTCGGGMIWKSNQLKRGKRTVSLACGCERRRACGLSWKNLKGLVQVEVVERC